MSREKPSEDAKKYRKFLDILLKLANNFDENSRQASIIRKKIVFFYGKYLKCLSDSQKSSSD